MQQTAAETACWARSAALGVPKAVERSSVQPFRIQDIRFTSWSRDTRGLQEDRRSGRGA